MSYLYACLYNGLLPTANMASPKYISKTCFCLYNANIFDRIFVQTTLDKTMLNGISIHHLLKRARGCCMHVFIVLLLTAVCFTNIYIYIYISASTTRT